MLSYKQKIINEVRQGINRTVGLTPEDIADITAGVKDFIDPFIVNVHKGAYGVEYVEFHERYLRKIFNGESGGFTSQLVFYYKILLDDDGNRLTNNLALKEFKVNKGSFMAGAKSFTELFAIAEDVTGIPIGELTHGYFDYT